MGHTPGPWYAFPPGESDWSPHYWEIEDEYGHTATVYGDDAEAANNARLIAAAPELLDACKLIAACLGDWIEVADRDADTSEDERRLAIAYAAIAKAEGRSE